MLRSARLSICLANLSLFVLAACSSPVVEQMPSNAVPQAVTVVPLDFPADEDVRKLVPEQGLSNASCGLNGEAGIEAEILERVNRLRAEGRLCGATYYAAVPTVTWNLKLQNASYHHALEMARANLISHVSIDSRELRNRVRQAGYAFSRVSENVAAGQSNVEKVISSWEKSPAHCAALMDPRLEEIGAACIHKTSSFYKFYWTMDMAAKYQAPPPVVEEKKTLPINPFLRIAEDKKKF